MDLERPAGAPSYSWDATIVDALRLESDEVGVAAWTEMTVGGNPESIYLPVQAARDPNTAPGAAYRALFIPGRELTSVARSVWLMNQQGHAMRRVLPENRLKSDYYPAGHAFAIEIERKDLHESGLYALDVMGIIRDGGVTSVRLWFYHSPSQRNR